MHGGSKITITFQKGSDKTFVTAARGAKIVTFNAVATLVAVMPHVRKADGVFVTYPSVLTALSSLSRVLWVNEHCRFASLTNVTFFFEEQAIVSDRTKLACQNDGIMNGGSELGKRCNYPYMRRALAKGGRNYVQAKMSVRTRR